MTIEGHSLTLIAQDGEPVRPVSVNTIISFSGEYRYSTPVVWRLTIIFKLTIPSIGERVDFILDAIHPIGAYWIQIRALGECIRFQTSQVAILRYAGGPAKPETRQPMYHVGLHHGIVSMK